MVELAQAEIIQIFRKRSGINQGDFGSRAFNTSYESGRTKMKNIELGRQVPTKADLKKMAALLNVPVSELMPRKQPAADGSRAPAQKVFLSKKVLTRFPGLDAYVDMLNNAARVNDGELLVYLCDKIASLLKGGSALTKQAAR
ncbi:MAG: helix-turn-helix transcriptional regulator [Desulfobacterales bacterium]|nr:helix-turn-helix transcriptional regulator [Desulfobacterales bacterium]